MIKGPPNSLCSLHEALIEGVDYNVYLRTIIIHFTQFAFLLIGMMGVNTFAGHCIGVCACVRTYSVYIYIYICI